MEAVLRQFGGGGYGGSDTVITDEEELHQHQKLEKLYISTRSAKVFQFSTFNYVNIYIYNSSLKFYFFFLLSIFNGTLFVVYKDMLLQDPNKSK